VEPAIQLIILVTEYVLKQTIECSMKLELCSNCNVLITALRILGMAGSTHTSASQPHQTDKARQGTTKGFLANHFGAPSFVYSFFLSSSLPSR